MHHRTILARESPVSRLLSHDPLRCAAALAVIVVASGLVTCDRTERPRQAAPVLRSEAMPAPAELPVPPAGKIPRDVDSLIRSGGAIAGLTERIDFFSRALLGLPYDSVSPTGEGPGSVPDSGPLYNFAAFDCVTYIEHVLALARSRAPEEFLPRLTALRYRDGDVGYVTRNHFFIADWLSANGGLFPVLAPPSPHRVTRIIRRAAFFARKGISVARPDTVLNLDLWRPEDFVAALQAGTVPDGAYVIAFVKSGWRTIDANHAGIMLVRGGSAVLREASRLRRRTVELGMQRYVEGQREFLDGMMVAAVRGAGAAGD